MQSRITVTATLPIGLLSIGQVLLITAVLVFDQGGGSVRVHCDNELIRPEPPCVRATPGPAGRPCHNPKADPSRTPPRRPFPAPTALFCPKTSVLCSTEWRPQGVAGDHGLGCDPCGDEPRTATAMDGGAAG